MASRILPISMAPSVALASLTPARKVLVSGDDSAISLVMRLTARAACENKRVRFICGDNCFDPYAVSRFAKLKGARAEDALRSILIARAFTAYQLTELVGRLDFEGPNDFIVISGPCSTFFDDDVTTVDAARLFYRMLWRVVELARKGMTLLLVQGREAPSASRNYFLADLHRASDVVMRLDGKHSFTLEHNERPALPYLAAEGRMTGHHL